MAIDPREIELTTEQKRQLAGLAEQSGRSWADVLTDALRSYRPRNGPRTATSTGGSFYDSMKDIIGIVKDAPRDLSTNPKYMEGFGRDPEPGAD